MKSTIDRVLLSLIFPNQKLRTPNPEAINAMARSFAENGQLSPAGLTKHEDGYLILYGNTRFLAAKQLDWEGIDARIYPADLSPADGLRMSIAENVVRQQMTFVEKYDAFHEYAKIKGYSLNKAGLTQAGYDLNYKQGEISKCINAADRLTPRNKKKLVEAGIGGSLAYLVSQENKTQDQLVDAVIGENWSRKQLEQYFREKRQGKTKFEFRRHGGKLVVDVPRTSTPDKILSILKEFALELRKCQGLNLSTAARVIKEQS